MFKIFKKVFRILFALGFFAYIGVLFYESSLKGVISSSRSAAVAGAINDLTEDLMPVHVEPVMPTSFAFGFEQDHFEAGTNTTLIPRISPSIATYKSVVWTSSNKDIATVSNQGVVSFLFPGEVVITGHILETDISYQKTYYVTSKNPVSFKLTGIIEGVATVYLGETIRIGTLSSPINITNQDYIWEIENEELVSLDKHDIYIIIEGKQVGTTSLTVTHSSGLVVEAKIVVKERTSSVIATDFTFNNPPTLTYVGETFVLSLSFTPSNTTNKEITLVCSDESIIKLIGPRTLRALKAGTVVLTAYSNSNKHIVKQITVQVVNLLPQQINVTNQSIIDGNKQIVGRSLKLTFEYTYIDSTLPKNYRDLTFTSSNPDCVFVGLDGTLVFRNVGNATITITCSDGYQDPITTTFNVEVRKQNMSERFSQFQYYVRKVFGHFGAFMILGFWAYGAFFIIFQRKKVAYIGILLTGLFVASGTEILQLFIEGRYGSIKDVIINCSGYYISVIIVTLTIIGLELYRRKKKSGSKIGPNYD